MYSEFLSSRPSIIRLYLLYSTCNYNHHIYLTNPLSGQFITTDFVIRFEIEDVAEPDSHDHQENVSGQADLTVHSFGYNTAEAVPMTVYYRDSGEAEGKARPTLDNLRQRERQQVEPVQVQLFALSVMVLCNIIMVLYAKIHVSVMSDSNPLHLQTALL